MGRDWTGQGWGRRKKGFDLKKTKKPLQVCGKTNMDAEVGEIDEEKLDSFNLSVYFPSQDELEQGINRNGQFSIEKTESIPQPTVEDDQIGSQVMAMHMRAVMEGQIKQHFGIDKLDELFNMFKHKLEHGYSDITSNEAIYLFILLKRRSI